MNNGRSPSPAGRQFRRIPFFMTVLFYLLLSFRWFATLQKQCGYTRQQRGKKVSRPQDLFLKGLFRFFFLLKF